MNICFAAVLVALWLEPDMIAAFFAMTAVYQMLTAPRDGGPHTLHPSFHFIK